jgi:hypothetical protein
VLVLHQVSSDLAGQVLNFRLFDHGTVLAAWCSIMKTALATILALALLATAEPARCQENAKPAGERSWYGYQILLADGLGYAALARSLTTHDDEALGFTGVGILLVASPVIHGVHHQTKNLLGSVAMRLLIPLMAFAAEGGAPNGFLGAGVGMIVATVVDSALAWTSPSAPQPVPPPAATPPRPQPLVSLSSVGVVPTSNGASLMVGGRF